MEKKFEECCVGLEQWLVPDLFKALSDPSRVAIFSRLAGMKNEQTVSEVASCCPLNISVVSRHLKTLHMAGIVDAQKRGKEVFYNVRISKLVDVLRNLADALEACCPDGTCGFPGGENES